MGDNWNKWHTDWERVNRKVLLHVQGKEIERADQVKGFNQENILTGVINLRETG